MISFLFSPEDDKNASLSMMDLLSILLIISLPLSAFSSTLFGYVSLLLLLVSIVCLVKNWNSISISSSEKLFFVGSCAFPVSIALNMWVFNNWQWSLLDNPSRLILVLPIFLFMANTKVNPIWLCIGIILSACIFGLSAAYQNIYIGVPRAYGWISKLNSPITFGNAALLLSVLSIATYPFLKPYLGFRYAVLIVFVTAGLAAYACLLSGTRGGWVSVPFLAMIFFLGGPKLGVFKIYTLLTIFILFFLAYMTLDIVSARIDSAWLELSNMFSNRTFTRGSVGARLEMWWAAILIVLAEPLWGVGLGGYYDAKLGLIEQGIIGSNLSHFGYAHNEPIHYFAEMGLMGLVPLLGFYFTSVMLIIKRISVSKNLAIMAALVLLLRFDISLTQVQFIYNYTTLFYAMMFAMIAGLMCNPRYQGS